MSSTDPTPAATPTPTSNTATVTQPKGAKPIYVLMNFWALALAQLVLLAVAVIKGLSNNPAFAKLPIDIPTFSTTVTSLQDSITAAQSGDRNAIRIRNKYQRLVIQGLKQLAVYVEITCADDPETFASTGFIARNLTKNAPQPVTEPAVKSLAHGPTSGSMLVGIQRVDNAKSYNLRYAVMNGTTPGAWTTLQVGVVNRKITISNLTPGTIYGFQAQALGPLGLSDYSTLKTMMAI